MIEYGMFEYRESMGDAIYTRSGIYRVEYRRGCIYASLNIRGVDICNVQWGEDAMRQGLHICGSNIGVVEYGRG